MEVYLDNAATTKAYPQVGDLVRKIMCDDYGNPSSKHTRGLQGENYIRYAKEVLAKNMKCKESQIVFTSGGTESNNMALVGAAEANKRRGRHIITTCFEHPSVHEPLIYLEEKGYEVTYLPVDSMGHVKEQDLKNALSDDTILVSIMFVNNEIGSVQNIQLLANIVKEFNQQIVFHVDAIQAFGKYRIYPERLGIDLMSVSGHKVYGPKGIGFLYIGDKVKIHPLILGGGQQKGMRSGTENVPGIAGMAKAVELTFQSFQEKVEHLYEMKHYFIQQVLNELEGCTVNGCSLENISCTAPHVISVSFDDVRSEVLLHALEEKEIYVSSGSACSSNHPGISSTLQAIGVEKKLLDSTLRFSLSIDTTAEQIDYTVEALKELLPILRRYKRQ